ncbi:MAG: porphobilinogen synthase [Pseudomonadota bacterium]
MGFPACRPRRCRQSSTIRRMVREVRLGVDDLIAPLFVVGGRNVREEIRSLPGNYHLSVDKVLEECQELADLGVPAVLLFGQPEHKDDAGSEACEENAVVPKAIRALKEALPEMVVIADTCLCAYTSHGHCGVLNGDYVENDATLELIGKAALNYARAGADIIAPSVMMDGMVSTIRGRLDDEGLQRVLIMSYSAKYASGLYDPFFKEGSESVVAFGDKRSHQMDFGNGDEALREVALDLEEGADIIMVKPGLAYLDIVYRVKSEFRVPVAVYNVSGEYAMLHAAARQGMISLGRVTTEFLTAFKRAGADLIITYSAKEAARQLSR